MKTIKRSPVLTNILILFAVSLLSYIVLFALISSGAMNEYNSRILMLAGINVIVALGLNVITGFTGQLALGQAGFMMVGAYTSGIVLIQYPNALLPAMILGGLVSALFGLLIGFPTLRLRGDYLAITTLGFGEILRVIINNLEGLTGGASGLKGIPAFDNNDIFANINIGFTWIFWVTIIVLTLVSNLIKSSHGRAIISIREDEVASNSMGINVSYYKMFAFTASAFLAGIGGALYAPLYQYLDPKNTGFMTSVFFVVYVVFGGLGSITGTVISTVFLTYLQELLRFMGGYRLVFFGLLLVVMMIFWPSGIMGTREISIVRLVRKYIFRQDTGPGIAAVQKSRQADHEEVG